MKTSTDTVTNKGLPSFNDKNAIGATPGGAKKNGGLVPFKVAGNSIFPVAMSKKGIRGEMKEIKYNKDNKLSPTMC